MASLRQTVLHNALPFIAEHSFTRSALLGSIHRLPHHADNALRPDALLESLFGRGIEPEKSLVREWETQGLARMKDVQTTEQGPTKQVDFDALQRALARRIEWSSQTAGEHLVEAHSLLATPSHGLTTALPRPLTTLLSALRTKLLDPPYTPPGHATPPTSEERTTPSLSVPLVNPVPLLKYALTIADEALYVSRAEPETLSGELDWYTRRMGLAMIYLHAETHLLHPRPPHSTADPHLPAALAQLDTSMARYRALSAASGRVGEIEREMGQFAWFVWKSWGGLFRSRGWIR